MRLALRAMLRRNQIPGFDQLDWPARQRLSARALLLFCGTALCARLVAWTLIWWLAAVNLAWRFDFSRATTDYLLLVPLLWLLPGGALGRRVCINRLLGPHWPLE
jgi:hypothetical protein